MITIATSPEHLAYEDVTIDSPDKIHEWRDALASELHAIAAWNYKHKDDVLGDGVEAYHLGNPDWVLQSQMNAVMRGELMTLHRYLALTNGGVDDIEKPTALTAYEHWNDEEWWQELCDELFDFGRVPDDGCYYTECDSESIDYGPYENNYDYTEKQLKTISERYNLHVIPEYKS